MCTARRLVGECTNCSGANSVHADGNNEWVASGSPTNQSYLVLNDREAAGAAIDDLLCQPPRRRLET